MISSINRIKIINNINNNNNNNIIKFQGICNIRGYVSDNFKKFSKDKDKRKFYGQEFEKRQQDRDNPNQWEQQETHYQENINFQNGQFQFHSSSSSSSSSQQSFSIFKLIGSVLGVIIKNKLFPKNDYKDLYQFACTVLQDNKKLIKEEAELPYINVEKPTILFGGAPTMIPGLQEVIMILQLPTPPTTDENRHVTLQAIVHGKRLPDVVVQKSFPWNLFGDGTETVKSAEPTRVVLLVNINSINEFGQVGNEKKEIELFVSDYEIYENDQYNNNNNNNNNNQKQYRNQEIITLDPKYYHEVYKNNKSNKK
ncbi:hypothetical protein ACTFIZ_002014 [Dictyostelium cf. discoideum]